MGVAVAVLIVRLFTIQIIDDKFKIDASRNTMVYDYIYPIRGMIYDRNGEVLVGNNIAYDIVVSPREVGVFDTLTLAEALNVEPEFIRERMDYYRRYRTRIGNQPQTLVKLMPPEQYMKFSEVQYKYPGFKAQMRTIREYPINAGGNLLGYVSEVNADFIKAHEGEYRPGDYAGKTGLEAAREADLRGEKGYHIYLRDSHNNIKTPYRDGADDKEAVPGHDIVTTIDAGLQQYGQELMKNKVGSLVAIEPSTGEILAMVSSPGIDVSQLSDIGQHYNEIARDPHRPMFNRAVQASYPPGSVFKLVNGLIGLQEDVLVPSQTYPCHGGYVYATDHKLGCHSHRSPLNLEEAIMMSCNGYFCNVMKTILENKKYSNLQEAFDSWNAYVQSFGFGHKLGSDVPSELGGNIPSSKYYNNLYGRGGWRFPTIVSLSIGQGEIGATPLQIANLCATVANRGYYYIPHIIKDSEGVSIDEKYHQRQYTLVDQSQFRKVIRGMWRAVNAPAGSGNTAASAAVPGLDICGKTGTAQNPRGADNSVFMCFAPQDNPRIAVVAYIENAGSGASWASPIASLLVEKYLNGEISDARKGVETRVLNTSLMNQVKAY